MTDAELRQLRYIVREIKDLEYRIDETKKQSGSELYSKVSGSSKYFPYTQQSFTVGGEDPNVVVTRNFHLKELRKLWTKKKNQQTKELKRLEDFISSIPDAEARMIFRYRYIDGLKLEEIGELLHEDRSGIGKKIRKYLESDLLD